MLTGSLKMLFDELSIGTDIEDISRFRKKNFDDNRTFYGKIFTRSEIDYCLSKNDPYQHFAARFCAKEAFIKAMHPKAKDYKSIEIVSTEGRPFIRWKRKKFLVSLSHERDKAIAFVVVSKVEE